LLTSIIKKSSAPSFWSEILLKALNFSEVIGAGITDPSSNAPNAKQILENQEGCGVRGTEGTRIVGGSPIKQHEYPWLCSLKLKGGHICGITLISVYPQETILVGAAHCFNNGEK
jgi:hypothetical protein